MTKGREKESKGGERGEDLLRPPLYPPVYSLPYYRQGGRNQEKRERGKKKKKRGGRGEKKSEKKAERIPLVPLPPPLHPAKGEKRRKGESSRQSHLSPFPMKYLPEGTPKKDEKKRGRRSAILRMSEENQKGGEKNEKGERSGRKGGREEKRGEAFKSKPTHLPQLHHMGGGGKGY